VTVEIFLASPAETRRSISPWVTSTNPRIQNKAEHSENFRERGRKRCWHRSTTGHLGPISDMETGFFRTNGFGHRAVVLWRGMRRDAWLALFRQAGDILKPESIKRRTTWDGWTARSR
jgi:hypothetical protein